MSLIPPGDGVTYSEMLDYLRERSGNLLGIPAFKRLLLRAGVTLRQHPDPYVPVGRYDRFTDEECYRILREYWRARGEREQRKR